MTATTITATSQHMGSSSLYLVIPGRDYWLGAVLFLVALVLLTLSAACTVPLFVAAVDRMVVLLGH